MAPQPATAVSPEGGMLAGFDCGQDRDESLGVVEADERQTALMDWQSLRQDQAVSKTGLKSAWMTWRSLK